MLKIQNQLWCACLMLFLVAGSPETVYSQSPLFAPLKKTIVLDPGHGGKNAGAKGAAQTLEKDVALSMSKSMQQRLENNFNVVQTRTGDYDTDLTSRTETANRNAGDMLISLHTGADFIHETQGVVIYYYSPNLAAVRTGPDNAPGEQGEGPGTSWASVQKQYADISRGFALSLRDHLRTNPNLGDVRVEGLPVYTLAGADMPAVLIELGYITNPLTEKNLSDPGFLSEFSNDICEGIDNYFQAYSPSHPDD